MCPRCWASVPDRGVRVVHLFTGRYSETGREEGAALERDLLRQARRAGVRLLGPNCMGVYNPSSGLAFGYDFPLEPGGLGMFFPERGHGLGGHLLRRPSGRAFFQGRQLRERPGHR